MPKAPVPPTSMAKPFATELGPEPRPGADGEKWSRLDQLGKQGGIMSLTADAAIPLLFRADDDPLVGLGFPLPQRDGR